MEVPSLGQAGLAAFVWSTVPALLTALILAGVVWRTGGFNWLVAVVVAVIAFAIAAMLLPLGLDHARPYLAFLAGVVARWCARCSSRPTSSSTELTPQPNLAV